VIPKKPNTLFKEVAEELEISEDLVDKFITFYYKDVRKHLSEINHIRINLDGLGQMVIRPKTVENLILKYKRMVDKADTYEFSGYYNKKRLETRLETLYGAQEKIEEFNKAKVAFKKRIQDGSEKNLDK
jgi:hypothetical protein